MFDLLASYVFVQLHVNAIKTWQCKHMHMLIIWCIHCWGSSWKKYERTLKSWKTFFIACSVKPKNRYHKGIVCEQFFRVVRTLVESSGSTTKRKYLVCDFQIRVLRSCWWLSFCNIKLYAEECLLLRFLLLPS